MRAHENQRRTHRFGAGSAQRLVDRNEVVAVVHRLRVPAVCFEASSAILGEGDAGAGRKRDAIVVVQIDQFAELQMAGQRGGLRRDALHEVAVTHDRIREMIDDLESRAVVTGSEARLGDRHAHAVAESLPERSGRDLDAGCETALRVTGRDASPLAELPDLLERNVVAGHVEQAVEQHRSVSRRQDETIAVGPAGVGGIVLQEMRPQDVRHRRCAHRQARVAAIGVLHRVHRKEAQRVDARLIQARGGVQGGNVHSSGPWFLHARNERTSPGFCSHTLRALEERARLGGRAAGLSLQA